MKVYIVEWYGRQRGEMIEEVRTEAVFDSEEKAREYVAKFQKDREDGKAEIPWGFEEYDKCVNEYEVQ
jgi:hypothetical protein